MNKIDKMDKREQEIEGKANSKIASSAHTSKSTALLRQVFQQANKGEISLPPALFSKCARLNKKKRKR